MRAETEVHKVFYRLMAFALTGIAVLTVFAYPLGLLQSAVVGPVLALVLFLSPIAPAYILGYFIYRYSFFQIVVNPALFYSRADGDCVDGLFAGDSARCRGIGASG